MLSAVKSGELANARRLACKALDSGFEEPLFLNLRAMEHELVGRLDDALKDLRRAHVLVPKDFSILNACGLCLVRMDRQEEALRCFDQVIALAPEFGPGWFNKAAAEERLGEKRAAARSYGEAVRVNPENVHGWANIAFLAIRRGDIDAARESASKALQLQPGHPTAELVLADVEASDPALAKRRLERLLATDLNPFDRALALGQLGDVLAAGNEPDKAFASYSRSNSIFRETTRSQFEGSGVETIPQTLAWLTRWAQDVDRTVWRNTPARDALASPAAGHVFLLGFPRSGTTLAETVLANHPDVVSLEERNTLYASVFDFLTSPTALSRMTHASEITLKRYREDYWRRVQGFGVEVQGKVFVDKNPFNTLKLPLIYTLFPNAKVIFSIRDPRDVVLSCFRRRFNLNPSTFEFLDLSRTALNYADTMRFAEILRVKQPTNEYQLFYERLIDDFVGVARTLCDFIGVEWRDDLIAVSSRARRGDVASASSAQIARGLFADGVGQWRAFRDQIEPVRPILAPWITRFGYGMPE